MKSLPFFLAAFVACFVPVFGQQYDDVYFDPSKVETKTVVTTTTTTTTTTTDENAVASSDDDRRRWDDEENDDDEYYDDDDYDYQYSTRIRRFHRRNSVAYDYYDPFFVDSWWYDPFYMPGTTIYVVNDNDWFRYRRYNRWHRRHCMNGAWGYNSWNPYYGYGYNNWGPASYGGWGNPNSFYNPWNNVYVFNNYYYDPYWTYSGWNTYYTPPCGYGFNNGGGWYGGGQNGGGWHGHNDGGKNIPVTYSGPRRSGTIKQPPGLVSTTGGNGFGRHEIDKAPSKDPHARVISTDRDPSAPLPTTEGGRVARPSDRPGDAKTDPTPSRRRESAPMTDDDSRARPKTEAVPQSGRPRTESREVEKEPRPSRRNIGSDDNIESRPRRSEPTREESRPRREERSESRDRPQPQREERTRSNDSGGGGSIRSNDSGRGSSSGGGSSRGSSSSSKGGGRNRD